MKIEKLREIYFDCLREMYANSIGFDGQAGDFDELFANATVDDQGKHIPMEDYYIPKDLFEDIVKKYTTTKNRRLRPYERIGLKNSIWLGATPTSSKESWEERKRIYKERNNLKEVL